MNNSRMSSMLASPRPAIPMNACTADHTTAPPMAKSASEWNPSTSRVPTTVDSWFMRLWSELVCCTVMPVLPSQVELVQALVRAAVIGRKQAVRREVLVPHVPESHPLVIVAHFPVAIPGIQSQPALAPLPGLALRPAQDLRADAAPGLVARDRELVHIELVAAFFAPHQAVGLDQGNRAAHGISSAGDVDASRLDLGRDARRIELAPRVDALLLMPAARLAQQAHHRFQIGA